MRGLGTIIEIIPYIVVQVLNSHDRDEFATA